MTDYTLDQIVTEVNARFEHVGGRINGARDKADKASTDAGSAAQAATAAQSSASSAQQAATSASTRADDAASSASAAQASADQAATSAASALKPTGNPTAGQVPTYQADGNVTWATPAAGTGSTSATVGLRPAARALLGASNGPLPWLTGVTAGYPGPGEDNTVMQAQYKEWADSHGYTQDFCALTFSELTDSQTSWVINSMAGVPGRFVPPVKLIADGWIAPRDWTNDPQSTAFAARQQAEFQNIASGARDADFQRVATALQQSRPGAIVRLGHEWNGQGYLHSIGDTAMISEYVAAWTRARDVMKAAAPSLLFCWDISANETVRGVSVHDALTAAFPGADKVDFGGCDFYPIYDKAQVDGLTFNADVLRPGTGGIGLGHMEDFTREQGVQLCIPEWGIVGTDQHGIGDVASFADRMYAYCSSVTHLAWESYWDATSTSDLVTSARNSATRFPLFRARYDELWRQPVAVTGSGGTSGGTTTTTGGSSNVTTGTDANGFTTLTFSDSNAVGTDANGFTTITI